MVVFLYYRQPTPTPTTCLRPAGREIAAGLGQVLLYVYDTCREAIVQRKLTITIDEEVYEGLYRAVGARHISKFVETLVRPHVVPDDLDAAYAAMADDETREAEAAAWAEGILGDVAEAGDAVDASW